MTTSPPAEGRSALPRQLCKSLLERRYLILASNRGPLEYHLTPEGMMHPRRGSGAVVTAFSSLIHSTEFTWVASAMGEGDRRASEQAGAGRIKSPVPGHRIHVRFVTTPRRAYHKFYNIFCNPLLWFLQHYMWSSAYTPNIDSAVLDAWETGYVPVNQAFAEALVTEARGQGRPACIMLHDYHFYLVPSLLRQQLPDALLHHFIHIPWPSPRLWQLLPAGIRNAIFQSLSTCDVVGFQSVLDAQSFLEGCRFFLPDAQVDFTAGTINWQGRRTLVRAYPLSIDVEEIRRIGTSPRALEYERQLRTVCVEKTIVRVDRAEPSKNIVRGFRAYQLLLEQHPELSGKVKFLAFLVPSRTHIKQYERYQEEIDGVVIGINSTFGKEGWQPVQVFYENNYTQAIAGMRLYDALLVNPVVDGMNLVAKEGPVINTRAGVLILSEGAGAWEQLKGEALSVSAADLEGTAAALYQALAMPPEEREKRAARLAEAIQREDVHDWLKRQLEDLCALA
ncbi:MAG: trehalose-6-phosphate synthase [Chloroflexi bacterium]|nr:trehalose-6-phosphate synthase [Chloroflexota bacterium]